MQGYQDLDLRYFFTAGVTEVRCWTFLAGLQKCSNRTALKHRPSLFVFPRCRDRLRAHFKYMSMAGSLAPQCAGCIHGDMERGFIKAEVCACV